VVAQPGVDALAEGRAALMRGAWRQARTRFEEAVAAEESPAAYEGLGVAARYLLDAEGAVTAHERGYRLARERGDTAAAAKLAAQLAIDAFGLGRIAEANGWTERALMLTEAAGPSEGRALALALRAHVAMLARNDPAETLRLAGQALDTARARPARPTWNWSPSRWRGSRSCAAARSTRGCGGSTPRRRLRWQARCATSTWRRRSAAF
jgi:hypothetical protein